jgi:hypothetical protein
VSGSKHRDFFLANSAFREISRPLGDIELCGAVAERLERYRSLFPLNRRVGEPIQGLLATDQSDFVYEEIAFLARAS